MSSFGLGIVNYKKKKFERSIGFLNLAKSLNPFNYNIKCYCSIVLESMDQRSDALNALFDDKQQLTSVIYYRKAKLYESMNLSKVINNCNKINHYYDIGGRTSFERGY